MLPVSIEHQDIEKTASRQLSHAGLDRRAFALIFLVPDTSAPPCAPRRRAVGRAVIEHQNMVQLRQGAASNFLDLRFLEIRGDQRRDVGPVSAIGRHYVAAG